VSLVKSGGPDMATAADPWSRPESQAQHPPSPGAVYRPPAIEEGPPPGWVGKWRAQVPPEPTADPSTWPQLGVAPGAGPNVGAWAVRQTTTAGPDDQF